MKPLSRREFVAATAGLLLAPRTSRAADARVEVLAAERILLHQRPLASVTRLTVTLS